jgi:hypothetical protein
MNIPDYSSESFRAKKNLNSLIRIHTGIRNLFDLGSGMEKFGSGLNIPDQQHWFTVQNFLV